MVGECGGSNLLDEVVTGLAEKGWAVVPGFLPVADCRALVAEMADLKARGGFRPAGIGRGEALRRDQAVRSDLVHWLDEEHPTPVQASIWPRLEALRVALNRQLYLGLRRFEGHLAIYPPGSRYAKHVDQFQDDGARTVSCVLYLNEGWEEADGGALRLYDPAEPERVLRDVLPEAGTLACFLSGDLPHEVLVGRRIRYSATGWFRRDGELPCR